MRILKHRIRHISLRIELSLLFLIVSIIPVIVLGTVALRLFSQNMEQNGIKTSQNYLEFIDYRISEKMAEIHETAVLFAYDDSVVAYCNPDAVLSAEEREELTRTVERKLIRLRESQNAQCVLLIDSQNHALAYSVSDFPKVQHLDDPDYHLLDESRFVLFDAWGDPIVADGTNVIPYERIILSSATDAPVARLVILYKASDFYKLFADYEQGDNTLFYMILGDRIASCRNNGTFAQTADAAFGVEKRALSQGSGSFHAPNNTLISYRNNARWGYSLVEQVSMSVYQRMILPTFSLMIGLCLICVILCFILGSILSHSITKPIYQLVEHMNQNRFPEAQGREGIPGNEIAIINECYDDVLRQLEETITDYYEEQQKKKEAQIRALEFQINPHFLYNTLSTIIWLIDAEEDELAIEITQKLSEFFRLSISKGREYITIREEIRHVQLYIDIQKARYAGKIFVEYDVPESLLGYRTPKLVLQPLVENSIIHAMQMNRDKTCRIRIRVEESSGDLLLIVDDDGEAATETTIQEMNAFLHDRSAVASDKNYGIGISNVHDRVAMSYGGDYGLRYERCDGHTIAILKIKKSGEQTHVQNSDR